MQGKRAIGEVEARLRQTELVEVDALIGYGFVGAGGACSGEHPFRQVEAQNLLGSVRPCPAAEPAEAATEIDDA